MDLASRTILRDKLLTLRLEAEERAAERVAAESSLPYVNLDKTPI